MSEETRKIIPEKIHINSIKVFRSNLETSADFMEKPEKVTKFDFGFNHEIAHNIEEKRTRLRLFFNLNGIAGDMEPVDGMEADIIAEYGIEFHFHVENFHDFFQKNGDEVLIDSFFAGTLMGIAYSTSRGIILERMQGTFFEGVILPVINPIKSVIEAEEDEG